MNPDASLPPDAREARLTALLHGELPAAEAESLRAEIAADAALASLFRRLSLADSLARETVCSPEPKELSKPEPLQLAPERRAALLAKFRKPPANVVRVPAFARKAWADRHELLALAAMLVAVVTAAGMCMPALAKAKSKAQRVSAAQTARMAELGERMEREEAVKPKWDASGASAPPRSMEPVLARRYGLAPAGGAPMPAPVADNSSSGGDSLEVLSKQRADSDGDTKLLNEQVLARNAGALPAGKSLAANDSRGATTTEFFGSVNQPTRGENTVGETALADGFQVAAGNARRQQTWEFRTSTGIGGTAGGGFAGGAGVAVAGAPINSAAPAPVPAPQEGFAAATADTVAFAVEVKGPTVLSSELRSRVASEKKTELADQAAVPPANRRDVLARSLERGRGVDGGTRGGLAGAPRGYLDDASQSGKAESAVGIGFDVAKDGGSPNAIRVQERLAEADQGKFALFQQNGLATPRVTAQEPPPTEEAQSQAEAKERSQPLAILGVPAQVVEAADAPADVSRFVRAKAKADTADKGFVQLDRLAEGEELRQQVALGKPAEPVAFYFGLATNAATPALGDVPVLGRMFAAENSGNAGNPYPRVRIRSQMAVPVERLASDGDAPLPKLAPGAPEPQAEVSTTDNAFSTFSLNVSDVSFKLAAAALEKGQMPEPATVRTEEFINAFDYRDPEPVGGAPVAFAWERARYPFAHDRDLVRFSVKTAASGRQPGRPLNLVLLLDNSGSMERADRVRIRQECLRVLTGQLQPQDRVSVVAFARTSRLWVDGLDGAQAAELPGRVGELTPDGGTNLEEALRTAYQTASRHFAANGVNRVVLLTDGAANLGDVEPESLRRQVEANRKQGIALDCFGIGWEGLNDELLESLSRNGDGRYGFVNTPEAAQSEFAGQLVGALQIAASDVKVQVEWNPRRVTAYRQLGYAKHQLKKEQFRDNTVDAAEIGAAEAGNALYTVQVNPAGEGPLGTVRVRFRVPGTDDYREHEWRLLYDGTARPLDQAGPALRLAASASAFSEWLVSSPYAAEVTPDRLLGLLNGVTDTYAADPRPKQFLQMLQQAKSVSGK